ncbi:MAG: hypothetical protein R3324_08000, partial [Halobacteriales archaeon]|nr:hypothetical protein [Halobacteriales archaeon]
MRETTRSSLVGAMVVAASLVPVAGIAQSWSDYALTQFIVVDRGSPASILGMDDNGRLALLAREGIDEGDLRERTGARESQVQLLLDWRLLEREGSVVRTTFAVLDADRTAGLRLETASVADTLAELVAEDIARLRAILEAGDRG